MSTKRESDEIESDADLRIKKQRFFLVLNECKQLCLDFIHKFEDEAFWRDIAKQAKNENKSILAGIEELKDEENDQSSGLDNICATPSKMSLDNKQIEELMNMSMNFSKHGLNLNETQDMDLLMRSMMSS